MKPYLVKKVITRVRIGTGFSRQNEEILECGHKVYTWAFQDAKTRRCTECKKPQEESK